jgi:hypothetical protein
LVFCPEAPAIGDKLEPGKKRFEARPLPLALKMRADLEITECILEAYPKAVELEDAAGWLPLHRAMWHQWLCDRHNDLHVVQMILTAYPEACKKQTKKGKTPLHLGVIKQNASAEVF